MKPASQHWVPASEHLAVPKSTPRLNREQIIQVSSLIFITMILVLPTWNAVMPLTDTSVSFWASPGKSWVTVGLLIFIFITYCFTFHIFLRVAPVQFRNDGTLLMIVRIFLTFLGLVLVLQAIGLDQTAAQFNEADLCHFNDRATNLATEHRFLLKLRNEPECKEMQSVAECEGYVENEYTRYLSYVEDHFSCVGLCPDKMHPPRPKMIVEEPDDKAKAQAPVKFGPVDSFSKVPTMSLVDEASTSLPPALFSKFQFDEVCGVALRSDVMSKIHVWSWTLYLQALGLFTISILSSVLELGTLMDG